MNDIEPILRRLTRNAGNTLHHCKRVAVGECLGRVDTGMGKYTSIAAGGVIRNMEVNGVVEVRQYGVPYLTPLGVEVTQYIQANWDWARSLFRDPPRR